MKSSLNVYYKTNKLSPSSHLPKITTQFNSKSIKKDNNATIQGKNANSSYLRTVKDLAGNIQYDSLNAKDINKEQKKLKDILKKINSDTIRMVEDFSPKANYHSKSRVDSQSVLLVRDKQIINNQQIIAMCQIQIQKLKHKTGIIQSEDKMYFIKKITQIKKQIETASTEVRQIKWQNYRRGKDICDQQKYVQQVQRITHQNELMDQRVKKLRKQDQKINEQIKNVLNKTEQITPESKKAEKYFQSIKKDPLSQLKAQQSAFEQKKQQLDSMKKKNQAHQSNLQFQYFRCLKRIESAVTNVNENQNRINEIQTMIAARKDQIAQLQEQFEKVKQEKVQKNRKLNQFLQESKFMFASKTQKKSHSANSHSNNRKNTPEIQPVTKVKNQKSGSQANNKSFLNEQQEQNKENKQQDLSKNQQASKEQIKSQEKKENPKQQNPLQEQIKIDNE